MSTSPGRPIGSRRHVLQCLCAGAAGVLLPAHAANYELVPWPVRQPLPALAGTDLEGKSWRLQDLKGRAVLVNFWASWCEPCRAEMPTLQQLTDIYGPERLVVLTVNFKESGPRAAQFARTTGMEQPILLDPMGDIAKAWAVRVFPTTVLIGADGRPRQRVRGEMDWTSAEAGRLIEPLLPASIPAPGAARR